MGSSLLSGLLCCPWLLGTCRHLNITLAKPVAVKQHPIPEESNSGEAAQQEHTPRRLKLTGSTKTTPSTMCCALGKLECSQCRPVPNTLRGGTPAVGRTIMQERDGQSGMKQRHDRLSSTKRVRGGGQGSASQAQRAHPQRAVVDVQFADGEWTACGGLVPRAWTLVARSLRWIEHE